MSDDWRERFRSWLHPDTFAHPDSPAGGSGTGFSRPPSRGGDPWQHSRVPHPDSPAGRTFNWNLELPRMQLEERISGALRDVDRAASANDLVRSAQIVLGPRSFDLGVCYGIAENAAGMAGAALELGRIFVLGGLYDAAHLPTWSVAGPLLAVHLEARAVDYVFGPALRTARDQRNELLRELGTALRHPIDFIGVSAKQVTDEYASKWKRLQQSMGNTSLSGNFESGRIVGGVLVDVLILISTVGEAAKGAQFLAELPTFRRMARTLQSTTRAAGRVVVGESRAVRIGKEFERPSIRESRSAGSTGSDSKSASLRKEVVDKPLLEERTFQRQAEALDKSSGGHVTTRHGPDVSDGALKDRLLQGKPPDDITGKRVNAPPASTRFSSYEEVVKTQRAALDRLTREKGVDLTKPPKDGIKEYDVLMDHGRAIDDGYIGVGPKIETSDPITGKQIKVWQTANPVTGIQTTFTKVVWDGAQWKVVQHFPKP